VKIFITGGAGFIGSALARHLIDRSEHDVLVYDKLTYAGILASLDPIAKHKRFHFVEGDICDGKNVSELLGEFQPDVIVHLAAETHVDRSLDGPEGFIQTNLVGTYEILQAALGYWRSLVGRRRDGFRFHHISTDEVFGSLGDEGQFRESSRYDPRSPYAASKAGSDHLVRAWGHSYGLPILVTNCSNNFGPYQFPEKLIPLTIIRALNGETLPVYGDGSNVRDWLFVDDHAVALRTVFERGTPGETYNVGANAERKNIDVVGLICSALDRLHPRKEGRPYSDQICFVDDRPGHDHRYAIDASKIRNELGWEPQVDFKEGLARTVSWYLERRDWWQPLMASRYDGGRLGLNG
jgi:dTDP-glucose 4,6-dehydratase